MNLHVYLFAVRNFNPLSPSHRAKSSPKPGKKVKEQRRWEGGAVSSSEAQALNYSSPSSEAPGASATNGDIDVSSLHSDVCVSIVM